jgi:CheY-like chemotaxis protein
MAWSFVVVDDNVAEAARTMEQLQRLQPGAEVLCAESGPDALALLEEKRMVPSLVFLDYGMPGMNGIEFLVSLRGRRWLEGTPVAMLTAPIADRLVVNCYRFGACAFLTKPAQLHEMRETLRDHAQPVKRMTAATVIPGGAPAPFVPGTKTAA